MSGAGEYESLIDEVARRRFEEAWLDGNPQPIESFLPAPEVPGYLPTLEELVHIELEFAWSAYVAQSRVLGATAPTLLQAPLVETYLQRFEGLRDPAIVTRLIEQEWRVRRDVKCPASLDDYRHRFPQLIGKGSELESKLMEIAGEASRGETSLGETQAGQRAGHRDMTEESFPRPFGGYELLSQLGRGGMGIVYRARQSTADRIVALKVIRRDWLESMPRDARSAALDRFWHEAQAAAKIEHENIVRVYEVGSVEGEPFFSMQYIDGQSLSDLIQQHPLPGRRAAALLGAVARAVDAAHRRGILHRDLKPQNILIDSQTETPLVADFGLAKLVQANDALTCAGDVMGSPPYMSPEQARDSSLVTTQSDVYALGATLYHSLVGQPPFRADTVLDTLSKVVHDEPVPLRQIDPTIDPDLETICLKCLQKEPDRRYGSAAALADDMKCFLEGAPIAARPVGTLERCWLWCRRNPLVATLTVSTALFLLLTLMASVVGYFNTAAALKTAERRHRETRQVINDYFTRVSEDRLLNEPGMQPLRKELLTEVLPYFRRFLVEFANDPTLRDELAQTHFRIGLITEETDAPQNALRWYETARGMQGELLAEQPGNSDALRDLANTLTAIGRVLQGQEEHGKAREAFLEAIRLRKQLADALPHDHEVQRMLANAHMHLGLLEKDVGDLDGALAPYETAQKIRLNVLEQDPDNDKTKRDLGIGAYNLGVLAVEKIAYDPAQEEQLRAVAVKHLRQGETVFEQLLERDPRDLGNQYRLVLCQRNLADLEPDTEKAVWLYRQAIEGMKELAIRNPDVPEYQADLALLFVLLGRRTAEHGDAATAREHLAEALKILGPLRDEYPEVSAYRRDLARAQKEMAIVLIELRENSKASEYLRSAREHFQWLIAESPHDEEYVRSFDEVEQILKILSPGDDGAKQ